MFRAKPNDFQHLQNSQNDRCSNCGRLFDISPEGCKMNYFSWHDKARNSETNIDLADSVTLVFEGLLNWNEKIIPVGTDVSMCFDCLFIMSQLYRNYREFMERTNNDSYLRKLFEKCIFWPEKSLDALPSNCRNSVSKHTQTDERLTLQKDFPSCRCQTSQINEDGSNSDCFYEFCQVKTEQSDTNNFESGDDDSHNENVFSPSSEFFHQTKLSCALMEPKIHPKCPDPMKLPNGKWFLPKIPKVLLTKYVDGDWKTLDFGKTKILGGTVFRFSHGTVVQIPKRRNFNFEKACKICGKIFDKRRLYYLHRKAHLQEGTSKDLSCQHCGKTFSRVFSLNEHVKALHSEYRPFICQQCGKCFSSINKMNQHVRGVHTIEGRTRGRALKRNGESNEVGLGENEKKKRTCEFCQKAFDWNKSLREHIAAIHSTERPYICEQCGKPFALEHRLLRHVRITHNTEKTHECEVCHKKFKTSAAKTCHKKLQHTGEEPSLCNLCGHSLKNKVILAKHLLSQHCVDAVAKCEICERGFGSTGKYEEHLKIGKHVKPKWMRPPPKYKTNTNWPSYKRGLLKKKLERLEKKLQEDPTLSLLMDKEQSPIS